MLTAHCSLLIAHCSGYQFKLSSNIVANTGFIRQFAPDGKKLDTTHVSVFGGLTNVGLVVGQAFIPQINQRFGRRAGSLAFLFMLLIVS